MKKIIALMIVMALCLPVLFSCQVVDKVTGFFKNPLKDVSEMYNMSTPTKVVATTNQKIGSLELNCKYELVTGYVDNAPASVYTVIAQEIDSVESGGNTEVVKPIVKETKTVTEAVEGFGARTNGGEWNPQGSIWVIGRGRMALNLQKKAVENVKYEDHTLTFTIPAANAAKVLGEEYAANICSDVTVTLVDDGAVVTSIELVYNLAGDEAKHLPESQMTVKVDYTYDIEKITIE